MREPVHNGCPWTDVRTKYLNFLGLIPAQVSSPLVFHRIWASLHERKNFSYSIPFLSLFLGSACHLTAHCISAPLPSHSRVIQTCTINVKPRKSQLQKDPTFCISKYLSHGFRKQILIVLFLVIVFCISRLHWKDGFTAGPHNSVKIRTDRRRSKRGPQRWSKGSRNCPLRTDWGH